MPPSPCTATAQATAAARLAHRPATAARTRESAAGTTVPRQSTAGSRKRLSTTRCCRQPGSARTTRRPARSAGRSASSPTPGIFEQEQEARDDDIEPGLVAESLLLESPGRECKNHSGAYCRGLDDDRVARQLVRELRQSGLEP